MIGMVIDLPFEATFFPMDKDKNLYFPAKQLEFFYRNGLAAAFRRPLVDGALEKWIMGKHRDTNWVDLSLFFL